MGDAMTENDHLQGERDEARRVAAVTLGEQMRELRRELRLRALVYPRWIAAGRLSLDDAERQNLALTAALRTLERLHDQGQRALF